MSKVLRRTLVVLIVLAIVLVLAVGGYVAYLFGTYSRLEDNLPLAVAGDVSEVLSASEPHTVVTWNLGFGAYSADYSFFMDGGVHSRALSEDAVYENIGGAMERLQALDADLMLLQEVDIGSTRSYHIDESELVQAAFPDAESVFAQNYDSAYLFYPFSEPHGASKAGQMTLSDARIDSALRRSLPVEGGFMKFFDLDRCYSISRIPVDNGRTLCLYNLHLSAYTSDGSIADEQFQMMLEDMQAEREAGNYVIAGGDFNKDLPGNSAEIFGVSGEDYTWAQPLQQQLIPEGFVLVDSVDSQQPVPSCRNADRPYVQGESFVLTVDGFIVSDEVEVLSCNVEDTGFAYSDHNPVVLTFRLKD